MTGVVMSVCASYPWHAGRRTLRAEELAGDIEGLASNDDDLLPVQKLFGDCAGETTEQVTLAVNDNLQILSVSFSRRTFQRRESLEGLTTGSKVDISLRIHGTTRCVECPS